MRAMRAWVAWTLVVCALISVGLSIKSSYDQNQTSDRLCSYIQESSRVSKIRAAATLKRDTAQDAFLGASAKLGARGDKASPFTHLSRVYLRASNEVAAERLANPLPDAPENCTD